MRSVFGHLRRNRTMRRHLWIPGFALISLALWGCGGGEPAKPEQGGGPAGGAPPPAAAQQQAAAGGGMGAGGAAGGGEAKGAAGAGSGSAQDLLSFVPEDLKIAAGANIALLSDSATPFGAQLLEQFNPVLGLLERAGIKSSQIDQLWSGANREKGELVTCVRTKSNYDTSAVSKALGTTGKSEKIGHVNVHSLPPSGDINNAVAFVDGKTLLIGRLSTVTAALKDPKPGAIRYGMEALAQPKAYYWIAGDDGSAQKLNIKGFEGTEWLTEGSPKPRGMAKCLAKSEGGGSGSGFGPGGMGPGGMGPGGMRPGGMGPGMQPPGGAPGAGPGARGIEQFQ